MSPVIPKRLESQFAATNLEAIWFLEILEQEKSGSNQFGPPFREKTT